MTKKKSCAVFSVIGILFLFCCVTGYELAHTGNIVWDSGFIVRLLGISIPGGIALGTGLCLLLLMLEQKCKGISKEPVPTNRRYWFLPCWLLMLLCWVPAFLAYYPGIGAYDFTIQLEQITLQAYNEHHPLYHTLLLELFIHLGRALGDASLGMAIYSFLQMCLLSAVLAEGIVLLSKRSVSKGWLILLQVSGCLFPFHWFMSITATKDTIFSAFVLWQLLMLCALLSNKQEHQRIDKYDIGYLVATVLMILFRNNGRYAVLVLLVALSFMVLFGKKSRGLWVKLWTETLAALVVASLLLTLASQVTDARQGDKREMLSIPIQQLARCMVYHGGVDVLEEDDDSMEQADKDVVNAFILHEAYKEYRPDISDPVKRHTNTSAILAQPKAFLNTYIGLFLQYPGEYLNAALANNAGYLYPWDTSHAYVNWTEEVRGFGYIQTRWESERIDPVGIYQDSKWEWLYECLEDFADSNMYLKIPLLKYLLVPGTYLWLYLLLAAWLLVHRKYRLLVPLALILGYYVTLLLGPTVQLRYIYPVMIALPYLAIWLLHERE